MIKNIIIGILVLLVTFFATYASIKAKEADENAGQKALAEQHLEAAKEQEKHAIEQAARALIIQRHLEERLKK